MKPPKLIVTLTYIPVTVQGNTIHCPDAVMQGNLGNPSTLKWGMDTDRFEIRDIVFDPPGQTEFTHGNPTAAKGWEVKDNMNVHGTNFKYTITVNRTVGHGGNVEPLDPMIRNEP